MKGLLAAILRAAEQRFRVVVQLMPSVAWVSYTNPSGGARTVR